MNQVAGTVALDLQRCNASQNMIHTRSYEFGKNMFSPLAQHFLVSKPVWIKFLCSYGHKSKMHKDTIMLYVM